MCPIWVGLLVHVYCLLFDFCVLRTRYMRHLVANWCFDFIVLSITVDGCVGFPSSSILLV